MNEVKGAVRVRKCVFCVSGIDERCDVSLLVNYCRNKKVRVSSCRFLRSRFFGIKSARLCVAEADAAAAHMSSAEFWPENISARPWKFDDLPQSSEWMATSSVLANPSKSNPIQTSAINPDHITKGNVNVNCLVHKIHNVQCKKINWISIPMLQHSIRPYLQRLFPQACWRNIQKTKHITNFKKETNQKTQKPNDSLNLIFFNARSILNKLSELTEQINSGLSSQAPPHVIAVTETWLNASVPDSFLTIISFSQVLHTDRSSLSVSPDGHDNRHGGGVLLLFLESVKCRRRDDIQCLPESVWIELNLDQRKNKKTSCSSTIILGCVYRPPSMTQSDDENFTSLLEQSLERVNISKNMVVILGNFNATSPIWTCGVDR